MIPDGATEEFGNGQVGDFAHNVPQGEVNASHGGGTHDAMSMPEVLTVHHLPEVLGAGGILAYEQGGDILDGADDAARVPFKGGLAPAHEARLVGENLHEDPVPHPGVADERFNRGDFHRLRRVVMAASNSSSEPAATTVMCSW